VDLFRVFAWDGVSRGGLEGGPLFVARARQSAGRHDQPRLFGAWYCSKEVVGAIAESLQAFRGRLFSNDHFRRTSLDLALVHLHFAGPLELVDLDNPLELAARSLRPSQVATPRRSTTQRVAARIFKEGAAGILWWSTLNAEWTHVTLFHERVLPVVSIVGLPARLSVEMPEVREAADYLGVRMGSALT
jgi:hypothetical protein